MEDTHDYYYNDQWQLLTEVKDGSVEAIYHWHPFYVDALALRMRSSDTHFFLQDASYNVTSAVADATNAVVERYAYTPYGEVTFLSESFSVIADSAIHSVHLYTGRERDLETRLQLNRERFYASHMGRWVTRDPLITNWDVSIEFLIGTPEHNCLYNYVGNAPIGSLDPSGMIEIKQPCGKFTWKRYTDPGRRHPGWSVGFDPTGCAKCNGRIKLVQVIDPSGFFSPPAHFDGVRSAVPTFDSSR